MIAVINEQLEHISEQTPGCFATHAFKKKSASSYDKINHVTITVLLHTVTSVLNLLKNTSSVV